MYLFYVDESGDPGTIGSPSKYFVLSAICIHESNWGSLLDDLIVFRQRLKNIYKLKMTEEIHASVFINGSPNLKEHISKNHKILILRDCLRWLNERKDISIVTIRLDKAQCARKNVDVFNYAWRVLIQRIDNTLRYNNFIGGTASDKGVILNDNTDGENLRKILRKMRRHNMVPSRYGTAPIDSKIAFIIEDPIGRDSKFSYIHQMVDIVCYFARQYYEPNKTIRKKGLRKYYIKYLDAVVNKKVSPKNVVNYIVEL